MKKGLRITLYITIGILVITLMMVGYGTIGLKKAKNENIENIDISLIENGEYIGEYNNFRWSNTVEVTIENHEIVDIIIIESGNQSQSKLLQEIIAKVIEEQKIDIDIISGATATSKSMLKAIEDALK